MDQKRYEDAVAEFSAAAKAKPRDVNFRYNLAVALDANGDRNAAIAEVKKGLAIDPTFPSLVRAAEVFGIPTARK
jgi:Flp pilus assembly protein TadD